ncbi:hypothetical protein E2P81_ATG08055 [Venturia nashicola]|nr:hypothetical protein E2P81_ATG08055 [Venturia nashicola]
MSPTYVDPRDSNWLGHRIYDTLHSRTDSIWTYFHNFEGGWETWAQFEIATALTQATQGIVKVAHDAFLYETVAAAVVREEDYPEQPIIVPGPFSKVSDEAAKERKKIIEQLLQKLDQKVNQDLDQELNEELAQTKKEKLKTAKGKSKITAKQGSSLTKKTITKGNPSKVTKGKHRNVAKAPKTQRSDFTLSASTDELREVNTVELKCRTNKESDADFVGRVRQDIEKIRGATWDRRAGENADDKTKLSVWIVAISIDRTEDGGERVYEEDGEVDEEREEASGEYEDTIEEDKELVEEGEDTTGVAEPPTIDDTMYALAQKKGISWNVVDLTTDKRMKIWTYEFRIRTSFLNSLFSYSRAWQMHHDADRGRFQRQIDDNSVYYPDEMMEHGDMMEE